MWNRISWYTKSNNIGPVRCLFGVHRDAILNGSIRCHHDVLCRDSKSGTCLDSIRMEFGSMSACKDDTTMPNDGVTQAIQIFHRMELRLIRIVQTTSCIERGYR